MPVRGTPVSRMLSALVLLVLLGISSLSPTLAATTAIETRAREAFLLDANTGAVLLAKNADAPMPPASMTKLMTVYLVMERLKDGRLRPEDTLVISEKAWLKGGSKMFVEVGNRVQIKDLLRGVIVQSGNDAAIVLAEGIAGSEENFARLMNEKARELGMTRSHFVNATGWPADNHYSTARGLAILALATIEDFPEYYPIYSETDFTYNNIKQHNRNPLLYHENMGVDGLKTGHTEEAGYGLTASAVQGGRRLVLVVNGLDSKTARSTESERLMSWGFREFTDVTLFTADEPVAQGAVWMGAAPEVPLVLGRPLAVTLPRAGQDKVTLTVRYQGPLPAPITQGARVATLTVTIPGMPDQTFPLFTGAAVDRAGFFGRLFTAARHVALGTDVTP